MCLTAIEILFLIAGVWLLITGKIPNKLFQILFGKGDYQLSSLHARFFGMLLSIPLPLILIGSFLLGLLFPNSHPEFYAMIFEIIVDISVAITAIIIARKTRHSVPKDQSTPMTDDVNSS
jgi:hypothetical protein